MPVLQRLVPYIQPYQKLLVVSIACALGVAALWGLNLTATYPVVKTLLEGETLAEDVATRIGELEEQVTLRSRTVERLEAETATDPDPEDLALLAHNQDRLGEALQSLARYRWFQRSVLPHLPEGRFLLLALILSLTFVTTLIKGVGQYIQDYLSWKVTESIIYDLRNTCFDHALALGYANNSRRSAGELMSRFAHDLQLLTIGLVMMGGRMIREPFKAVVCLGLAFAINWRLTLLACILLPVIGLLFYQIGRRLKRASRRQMEAMTHLYGTIEETFEGLKTVQLAGATGQHVDQLRKDNRDQYRESMRIARWDAITSPTTETLGILAAFVALVPGAYLVLRDTQSIWDVKLAAAPMDIAGLCTLYLLLIGTLDPLRRLSSVYTKIKRALTATERIFDLLDETPDVKTAVDPLPLPRLNKRITFREVSFRYPTAAPEKPPALTEVDLTVTAGETVLIVGENGCGKSTLVSLLPRFFDPDAGTITLDGIDLTQAAPKDLRKQIGLVGQETYLFEMSLAENIRFGRPTATDDEVRAAADRAFVTEFLPAFPEALDTNVGPRGDRLSGGQRQRVALARAMLKDPAILILDEATSAIDQHSERLIHQALAEFTADRTTLIVTHKLPPELLAIADRIVMMTHGQITATGSHTDLLTNNIAFRRQFGSATDAA